MSTNPVVTFGMYKGKQPEVRLQDLPDDYLKYLTRPTKDGDFSHRGVNWTQAAKNELVRRKNIGFGVDAAPDVLPDPVPPHDEDHMPIVDIRSDSHPDYDQDGVTVPSFQTDNLADVMEGLNDPHPPGTQQYVRGIADEAIDAAVAYMLKLFLTRLDKTVRFLAWLYKFTEEAARHGTTWTQNGDNVVKEYSGFRFEYRQINSRKLILLFLEPVPVSAPVDP